MASNADKNPADHSLSLVYANNSLTSNPSTINDSQVSHQDLHIGINECSQTESDVFANVCELSRERSSFIQRLADYKPYFVPRHRNKYENLEQLSEGHTFNVFRSENFIYLPKLNAEETEFLNLVSNDDVCSVRSYLENHPMLNVNCTNIQGVSALQIAVQNDSEQMVEILLAQPNVDVGDAVLHAVKKNNMKILVMLLDAQQKISPGLEFAGTTHSTEFPLYITPLILASQMGLYEVVQLLTNRGHTISRPHVPECVCVICKKALTNEDHLYMSGARLSVYRAISSPAYLIHVSSDPILAAFSLAAELEANASAYRQLAAAYLQLRDDVSGFAVDLIGCCRTSDEVELVLKQTSGTEGRRHFVLPRLLMAVDYEQKEFVAHPNTQQVLESYWMGEWYDWRCKSMLTRASIIVCRVFFTPIILFLCMITPRHRIVTHWQIPLNKLITHVAAYFVFLALVFYISNQDKTEQKRGPPNTGVEAILILYVCGYTWSAVRMCLMQGPRRYFTKMWNWTEIIMLTLFGVTFAFWVAAAIDVAANKDVNIERKYWSQYDPTLLAEGTFCLATVFAFFRLMFLCQLNYHLGPLQVSLGKMIIDIYKYIIVFTIIISAFAAGLARFYQYYDGMVYEDEFGMKTMQVSSFTSLTDTLNTLFWALFCMAPLDSADVVLENTRDPRSLERIKENKHTYTERIGYLCFGCFEVISVIVVLNMLIATMSNTFQRVNDNVVTEWTFEKTEVYIDYMMQTTLPSPYNMIPTASGIGNIIEWISVRLSKPVGARAKWSSSYCCYIERDVEASVQREFPALMSVLIRRYFRDKETNQKYFDKKEYVLEASKFESNHKVKHVTFDNVSTNTLD